MLYLEAKCIHFTCIVDPGTLNHPNWLCFALATNHQEHWPTTFVERVIREVTLIEQTLNFRKRSLTYYFDHSYLFTIHLKCV